MENILSFSDNFHKTYNSDINYSLQFKDQLDIEIIDHNLPVHLCTCGKKPHLIIYKDNYRKKDIFIDETTRFKLFCPDCDLIGDRPNLNQTIEFWNKMLKLRTLYIKKLNNGELLDEMKPYSQFIASFEDWSEKREKFNSDLEFIEFHEKLKRNMFDYPSNIFFPDEEHWNEIINEQNEDECFLDENIQNILNDFDIESELNIKINKNLNRCKSYSAQNMRLMLPHHWSINYDEQFINQIGNIETHNLPLCLCTCGDTAKLHIKKLVPMYEYPDYEFTLYCSKCELYSKDTNLTSLVEYWNEMFLLRHEYQDQLNNNELEYGIIDYSKIDRIHFKKNSNIYFPNKELWERYSIPNNIIQLK